MSPSCPNNPGVGTHSWGGAMVDGQMVEACGLCGTVKAHTGPASHRYLMHYPEHPARQNDPHYKDFEEYRRRTKDTARCSFAVRTGDSSECHGGLELHHSHVEFSLQNGVDLQWLERDYEGISNPDEVGAWVESARNLEWYCEWHHRGAGGVHTASASDFEAEHYVRGLISQLQSNDEHVDN